MHTEIKALKIIYFYAYLLNEYAKEDEEKKKKKKKTNRSTSHTVLLNKTGVYLFSVSLTCLMIVSDFSKTRFS